MNKKKRNINIINLAEDTIDDDEKIEETVNQIEEVTPIESNDIEVKEQTPLDVNQEINLETSKNEIEVKKGNHFQISESFKEWNQKEEALLKPRVSKFAEKVLIRAKETKEIEKKLREKEQMERQQIIEEKERERYDKFTEEYRREINDERIRNYENNYKEDNYKYREDYSHSDYNYGKNFRNEDLRTSTPRRYKEELLEEQPYSTKSINGKRDHLEEQSREAYSNTYVNSPVPAAVPPQATNSIQIVAEELRKSFKVMASQSIVKRLSKYLSEGKIQNKDDFKHLSRKITHSIFGERKKR